MKEFYASLLREKFLIFDPKIETSSYEPIKALSNRLVVPLTNDAGKVVETYVIRAHNMHLCTRFAARIIHSFIIGGPFTKRARDYQWDAAWDPIVNDYERRFNKERWVCVYSEGKVIFEQGDRHPLLDVIEKCDFESDKEYDYAIPAAENAFKATGKVVKIDQDSNVALAISCDHGQARFGIILRGPNRTTTFKFSATPKPKKELSIPQCLSASAAFLEGIQLAFLAGMNTEKIRLGIIERFSDEEKQTREAKQRLVRLNAEIASLETNYDVRYRPEKPEFHILAADAEALAQKLLAPKDGTNDAVNGKQVREPSKTAPTHAQPSKKKEEEDPHVLPPRTMSAQNSHKDEQT